ncbi:hypothetical protein ACXYX3_28485 (plasmid) [Mycobacterium sp. C3-094]|uniref:hypothetical protein n=1 Tax=Mycobacterium sp. PSTR-4-N TaxID=2917745 RepID=UPI001F14F93C|nr:hypothetical protein [Mycobacterium sp. PSTR-4-N]MCG7594915.1 hypothetical protein [Mycobacterium sp. PSTR-4-N]
MVIGMDTKRVPGGEIIRKICPVAIDGRTLQRCQRVIEHRLYPPPDMLRIESVPVQDGGLMLIDVPPQPEELKPFLVHGAVIDGRTETTFISVVRRRGESSIPMTPQMIHSTLAAGRALLRRGQLPHADPSTGSNNPPG